MKFLKHTGMIVAAGLFATTAMAGPAAAADPVADFYKGKRVDLVIGSPAGGGYDRYARAVAHHIGKHLPGNPTIIARNMPGAGTLVAANWLYSIAPKDGSVIASVNQTVVSNQAKGRKGIKYDARKFFWIGTPLISNRMVTVWHTTGAKTIEDAKKKEIIIGAAGLSSISVLFPQVSNVLFGTRFKIIAGYRGLNDILLAMERGEVEGVGASSSWNVTRPAWLREKKINVLFQVGPRRDPDFPDVPLLTDLAQNDEQRRITEIVSADIAMGYPILTAPGVPAERVAALRKAFDETMKDPAFLAEAVKSRMVISPVRGEDLQRTVDKITNAPANIVAKINEILQAGNVTRVKKKASAKK